MFGFQSFSSNDIFYLVVYEINFQQLVKLWSIFFSSGYFP